MITIIIIILLLALLSFFMGKQAIYVHRGKRWNSYLTISFIIVYFLYVFKDISQFPDIDAYLTLFKNSKIVSWKKVGDLMDYNITDNYELGWCVFNKALSTIFNNGHIILYVVGFIIIFCYWKFFARYSKYLWLAIILFFVMRFYNACFVLRQNTAVAICLLSVPFIIQRDFKKFLLCIFFACSFHQSAILFIIMFFIYNVPICKKYVITFLLLSLVVYELVFLISQYIFAYFPVYEVYMNDTDSRSDDGSNYKSLLISFAILIFYWLFNRKKKIEGIDILITHGLLFYYMISLVKIGLLGTVGRLNDYFEPFVMLGLANTCSIIRDETIRIVSVFSIITLYLLVLNATLNYGFSLDIF